MSQEKAADIGTLKQSTTIMDIPCDAKKLITKINAWFNHDFKVPPEDKFGDYHCANPRCGLKIRVTNFHGNPMLQLLSDATEHPLKTVRDFKIPECGEQKNTETDFCHEGHSYRYIEGWH